MFETFNSLVTLKVFLLVIVSLSGVVSPQRQGISAMAGVLRHLVGREEAGRVPFPTLGQANRSQVRHTVTGRDPRRGPEKGLLWEGGRNVTGNNLSTDSSLI